MKAVDKIQIVSLLLTRKCNLSCNYCAISRNYKDKPFNYPEMAHYHRKEMSTEYVKNTLSSLKKHNPDVFILIYGGEPLLRKDLPEIIQHCHDIDVHYTIISNNTDEVEPALENLIMEVEHIEGYTFSIDPLIVSNDEDDDRIKKSKEGLDRVLKYKDFISDPVAEVTIDNRNIEYILPLVRKLTKLGICSDLTFIDIAHTKYYDFSNIKDENLLVLPYTNVHRQFNTIYAEKLNVHLGKPFYDKVLKVSGSNMDCTIDENIHNLTIDADGSIRLCLRIRGVNTPGSFQAHEIFMKDGKLRQDLKGFIKADKDKFCRGCNWTCMIMSDLLSQQEYDKDKLVHSNLRGD